VSCGCSAVGTARFQGNHESQNTRTHACQPVSKFNLCRQLRDKRPLYLITTIMRGTHYPELCACHKPANWGHPPPRIPVAAIINAATDGKCPICGLVYSALMTALEGNVELNYTIMFKLKDNGEFIISYWKADMSTRQQTFEVYLAGGESTLPLPMARCMSNVLLSSAFPTSTSSEYGKFSRGSRRPGRPRMSRANQGDDPFLRSGPPRLQDTVFKESTPTSVGDNGRTPRGDDRPTLCIERRRGKRLPRPQSLLG